MKIIIKVIPRSSKNELKQLADGSYKAKLTAPPVDGKANEALIEILAEYFNIPKSKIKIARGLTSKNKTVKIN
ncbi:MAG: DUF167 domain-containing protein [Candidatus Magasanikbacteria bacterium]